MISDLRSRFDVLQLQGNLEAITVDSLGLAAEDIPLVQDWIAQYKPHTCAHLGCGTVFTLASGGGLDCGSEGERHRQRRCVHCKRRFR